MAQTTLNREQETQRIHQDYSYLYRYLRGFILVVFGIWLGSMFFSDTEGYATNVFTELIGIFATYLIFDEITKRANKQQRTEDLLVELKSPTISPAVNALSHLRRENLLDDNYFIGKDLQHINWEGAYIGGLNFKNANMSRINLKKATSYMGKELQAIIFKGTNLRLAHLEGSNLIQANFEGANLQLAYLEGAILASAHLEKADLTQATLKGAHLTKAQLKHAILKLAHLEGAILREAHLAFANLEKACLEEANLTKANFEGANLQLAHLEHANLDGAQLQGADLRWAYLEGANLPSTNLQGADLCGARLQRAEFQKRESNVGFTNRFKPPVILPDGTVWTPNEDMQRFTNPLHPKFKSTLEKINFFRQNQGYEPLIQQY